MTEKELANYITAGNKALKVGNIEGRILTMFYWKDEKGENKPGVLLQVDPKLDLEPDRGFMVADDLSNVSIPNER
jgi:hypothetical protein